MLERNCPPDKKMSMIEFWLFLKSESQGCQVRKAGGHTYCLPILSPKKLVHPVKSPAALRGFGV